MDAHFPPSGTATTTSIASTVAITDTSGHTNNDVVISGSVVGATIFAIVLIVIFILYVKKSGKDNNISPKNSDIEIVVDINYKNMLDNKGNNNNDKNNNGWLGWLDEAIKNEHINLYKYNNFKNLQKIGSGGYSKVYKATYNNDRTFALKSYICSATNMKEITNEVRCNILVVN